MSGKVIRFPQRHVRVVETTQVIQAAWVRGFHRGMAAMWPTVLVCTIAAFIGGAAVAQWVLK